MGYITYDITDNNSYFNLDDSIVVQRPVDTDDLLTSSVSPTTNNHLTIAKGESSLEKLYEATDGEGDFNKVVDFLGNMAEAESMKGKQTYNTKSSAAGIYHFLVGDGGGYDKDGKRTLLGQHDKSGTIRSSSFETAKRRLKLLANNPEYSSEITKHEGLVKDIGTILSAKVPDELTVQQQSILAYANLKLRSSDFTDYLKGRKNAVDVYSKVWVTYKDQDSLKAITRNWNRAVKSNADNGGIVEQYNFLGLSPRISISSPVVANDLAGTASDQTPDQPSSINTPTQSQSYSSGGTINGVGSFITRLNSKRTLI